MDKVFSFPMESSCTTGIKLVIASLGFKTIRVVLLCSLLFCLNHFFSGLWSTAGTIKVWSMHNQCSVYFFQKYKTQVKNVNLWKLSLSATYPWNLNGFRSWGKWLFSRKCDETLRLLNPTLCSLSNSLLPSVVWQILCFDDIFFAITI